jgi:transcriptional regulator with XRE-family HTH domain
MLGERASDYFKKRDEQDPKAKRRRHYLRVMLSITESIVQMRKAAGITQDELARRMRTSQSTIALWETPGYTGYSLQKLCELGDQLGYSLKNLEFVPKSPTLPQPTPTSTNNLGDAWGPGQPGALFSQADDVIKSRPSEVTNTYISEGE